MAKLKQADGNWVIDDRFWDREADLELFMEKVDEGANLLLTAQRRMGKTSLMREAARRLAGRYICLFVDLEKANDAADVVVELSLATHPHKTLWEKASNLFSNILAAVTRRVEKLDLGDLGVTLRAGLTTSNWRRRGDQLFDILASSGVPVVLLVDEVPILVNRLLKGADFKITPERRERADEFMSWLRHNSQRHAGKVRIVLSGSIGLEPILEQAGLSATVNNFARFELKPWEEAAATECLEALANQYGVQFEDGTTSEMVRRIGCCIPHHVQMFFGHVYDLCKRRGRMTFGLEEVADLYEAEMLGTRGHAELTHYEERLKLVLGSDRLALALDMLTEAAVVKQLSKEAIGAIPKEYTLDDQSTVAACKHVLSVLAHDGYLKQSSKGWVFVSNLVRDWWEKRHESFFTPILQRGE